MWNFIKKSSPLPTFPSPPSSISPHSNLIATAKETNWTCDITMNMSPVLCNITWHQTNRAYINCKQWRSKDHPNMPVIWPCVMTPWHDPHMTPWHDLGVHEILRSHANILLVMAVHLVKVSHANILPLMAVHLMKVPATSPVWRCLHYTALLMCLFLLFLEILLVILL